MEHGGKGFMGKNKVLNGGKRSWRRRKSLKQERRSMWKRQSFGMDGADSGEG